MGSLTRVTNIIVILDTKVRQALTRLHKCCLGRTVSDDTDRPVHTAQLYYILYCTGAFIYAVKQMILIEPLAHSVAILQYTCVLTVDIDRPVNMQCYTVLYKCTCLCCKTTDHADRPSTRSVVMLQCTVRCTYLCCKITDDTDRPVHTPSHPATRPLAGTLRPVVRATAAPRHSKAGPA